MIRFFILCLCFLGFSVQADTLTTKNYVVTIDRHCDEGHVSCSNVSYLGRSKISGNSIRLKGETLHSLCADGVTPCRFLGYRFKNEDIQYIVFESGLLQVRQGTDKILLEEQGVWTYE